MSEEKSCFVIMPISDIPPYEEGHFERVYEYIIKPAVTKAGFIPLRADEVQKTNLIIVDILKQIINSSICVCDLSSRNPNVLYELGIRQAFDLPVVLIRDSKTPRIFDIQSFRDISYDEGLRIDKTNKAVDLLSDTIINTFNDREKNINSYMRLLGKLPDIKTDDLQKLDSKVYDLDINIEKYLKDRMEYNYSKKTVKNYKYQLLTFLKYSNKSVNEFTQEDIKSYLDYRESKGILRTTLEFQRMTLKKFFAWLVDERIINDNPVRKIKPYIIPNEYVEPLNNNELGKIRNACISLRDKAIIEVFISTGCTLNELINIERNNIDWDRKELTIYKTRTNRIVLLSSQALSALQAYLGSRNDDCKEVFITERGNDRKLGQRAMEKIITDIMERAELTRKISSRVFRHTFAKTMLEKGMSMDTLQTLLGNKDYSSTYELYKVKLTSESKKRIHAKYIES